MITPEKIHDQIHENVSRLIKVIKPVPRWYFNLMALLSGRSMLYDSCTTVSLVNKICELENRIIELEKLNSK